MKAFKLYLNNQISLCSDDSSLYTEVVTTLYTATLGFFFLVW